MINGVLVERTVKDVLPQLKTNADGLKKVLDDLLKQYTGKQEELEKWKVSHSWLWKTCIHADPSTAQEQDSGRPAMRAQYAPFITKVSSPGSRIACSLRGSPVTMKPKSTYMTRIAVLTEIPPVTVPVTVTRLEAR